MIKRTPADAMTHPAATPAARLKREQDRAKREALELAMLLALRAAKLTDGMVRQWRPFAGQGGVDYRYDFAWPWAAQGADHQRDRRLTVVLEVQGGIWRAKRKDGTTSDPGAHARGAGITRDIEKSNRANLAGMVYIAVTAQHIKSGQALAWVEQALRM